MNRLSVDLAKVGVLLFLSNTVLTFSAHPAQDNCERDDSLTPPGQKRIGQFLFEGGYLRYDSRRQINSYGEARYIWCIENQESSYNATVHWGNDDDPKRYYGNVVQSNSVRGKYMDDSRDIDIQPQSFVFWRNWGNKYYEQPETVHYYSEFRQPFLGRMANLLVGRTVAQEQQNRPFSVDTLDPDSIVVTYLLPDGSLDLSKLVQDPEALDEYISWKGDFRRSVSTLFDMPGSVDATRKWLEGEELAEEELITLNFSLTSIIEPAEDEFRSKLLISYRASPFESQETISRTLEAMSDFDVRVFLEGEGLELIEAWNEVTELEESRIDPSVEFTTIELTLGDASAFAGAAIKVGLLNEETEAEFGVLDGWVFEPR